MSPRQYGPLYDDPGGCFAGAVMLVLGLVAVVALALLFFATTYR